MSNGVWDLMEEFEDDLCSPWLDPDNDEWMNRFSEEKENKLYEAFKKAGKLEEYRNGSTDI